MVYLWMPVNLNMPMGGMQGGTCAGNAGFRLINRVQGGSSMRDNTEGKKPVLVIMAAGMGSRYGGLKQIDPIDSRGHIIMDYSIYDAKKAGFEKVIFIIKKENEVTFREVIGNRVASSMEVGYVFQDLQDIPAPWSVPQGRIKPWGTGHAVYSCRNMIDGPFAVINADDYYGAEGFSLIYEMLRGGGKADEYAMVSYVLSHTLTENGHVARGVCSVDQDGFLKDITERVRIIRTDGGAAFSEDEGVTWTDIDPMTQVSMNLWGFPAQMLDELEQKFASFLEKNLAPGSGTDVTKCEFYLPFAVNELMKEGKVKVRVLPTKEHWYGVTYHQDKQTVVSALENMVKEGKYPEEF